MDKIISDKSISMYDVIFVITGLKSGGAERNLLYLCRDLELTKALKVVVLGSPNFYSNQFEALNCDIEYLGLDKFKFLKIISFLVSYWKTSSRSVYVVSWLYHADFFSIILKLLNPRAKVIWNVRTAEFGNDYFRFSKFLLSILKFSSYFVPHKILYNSQRGMDSHQSFGYCSTSGALVSNFFIPPNGFNPNEDYKVDLKRVKLGFIGRFAKQKGLDILLSAFYDLSRIFPCLELHIAGVDKSLLTDVQPHENIRVYGKIKDTNVFYNSIDALVLPSRFGEGTPNVILEALSYGKPCVSTAVGDISRLLENDRGIVVRPNNLADLTVALKKLIENERMFSKKLQIERRSFVFNAFPVERSILEYKRQAFV